MIGAEV